VYVMMQKGDCISNCSVLHQK